MHSPSSRSNNDDDNDEEGAKKLKSEDLTLDTNTVTEVGTTNPVDDFTKLIQSGQDLVVGECCRNSPNRFSNAGFFGRL